MSSKEQYEFEQAMSGIFDEGYFAFLERFKKDPSAGQTYLRYLKDVLFLDTDEHLALFKTYGDKANDWRDHCVEISQDSTPKPRRLKRI